MLSELFLTALLTAGGFNVLNECYVRGFIYAENGMIQLSRGDICDVTHQEIEDVIILHDRRHWVYIKFPVKEMKGSGHIIFWYRWGTPTAFFGVDPLNIKWGNVKRG